MFSFITLHSFCGSSNSCCTSFRQVLPKALSCKRLFSVYIYIVQICMYKPPASGWWFTGDLWTERGWRAWSLCSLQEMTNSQLSLRTNNPSPPPNPSVPAQRCSGNGLLSQNFVTSKHESENIGIKIPIDLSGMNLGEAAFSALGSEMENVNCASYLCSVLLAWWEVLMWCASAMPVWHRQAWKWDGFYFSIRNVLISFVV